MILLDTNVVSEAMKAAPATDVMAWLRARPLQDLAISAVTLAEIRYGLARLPEGLRGSVGNQLARDRAGEWNRPAALRRLRLAELPYAALEVDEIAPNGNRSGL